MAPPIRIIVPVGGSIGAVNAYLLADPPTTVVDPGPDTEAGYAALRDGLADAGIGIASVERIVITHGHVDHAGLAGRLNAECGARVLVHPAAADDLADFERAWTARTELVMRAARAARTPPEIRDAYLDVARIRRRLFGIDVPRDALVSLSDGARFRAGGAVWETLHTPGHAHDHLAVRTVESRSSSAAAAAFAVANDGVDERAGAGVGTDEGEGEAIVGDLLVRGALTTPALELPTPAPGPEHGMGPKGPEQGQGTLERLIASWRGLGRWRAGRAWPGHGPAIRAPRVLIARRIAELRTALRHTHAALSQDDLTAWEVAMRTGLSDRPERLLGTLGIAYSQLEWLHARGLARRERRDGITRYRRAAGARQPL